MSVIHAHTLTAVDADTTTAAVDPIQLGTQNPEGVAVHPKGTKAYVTTNVLSSSVSVIDVPTNTVTATITELGSVGMQPVGVAVHPTGRWVFVANSVVDPALGVGLNLGRHSISVIDTRTDMLLDLDPMAPGIQQIELIPETQADVPFGIAVHPNGSRLYVTNNKAPGSLTVIDFMFDPNDPNALPAYAFVENVILKARPSGVAVSADGIWVFVAQEDGVLTVINANGVPENVLEQTVGGRLFGVAAHPTAPTVYVTVTNPVVDMVDPVDTLTVLEWTEAQPLPALPSMITPITVGQLPRGVAVTRPDGGLAYVANFVSNSVSVINTASKAVMGTIPVGAGPVAFGDFIGFPSFDKDGDGIWNVVDGYIDENGNFVDQSDVASVNFTNRHLCGTTSGSITSVPAGMMAGVVSPAGIIVGAAGGDGTQQVTVHACGFDLLFNPFEVAVIDNCGSLTSQVLSGPIDVVLPGFGVATVPTGVTVRVAQTAPGQFEVQNLGGPAAITVDFAGHVIQVTPGRSRTLSGAQLVHDACPCAGPSMGGAWKNHGAYVSCVAREADGAAKSGLITHEEKGAMQSQAARSSCAVK